VLSPDGWKLNCHETGEHELYNLNTDPDERENLYRDHKGKSPVKKLSEYLHRWQSKTNDDAAF
jgi:hypothetical protein